MNAMHPVPPGRWVGFHLALLILLTAELVFARRGLAALGPEARARRQHRTAIAATVMWITAALLFAAWILHEQGSAAATQFLAGYTIEESLSIDNLFVFLLLFRVFTIPPTYQPRVLFWGVLGAILLRGGFIAGGIQLLARFDWVSYVFALILLVAAIRLVIPGEHGDPDCVATDTPPPLSSGRFAAGQRSTPVRPGRRRRNGVAAQRRRRAGHRILAGRRHRSCVHPFRSTVR